jgi:hypothetical protein
MNALVIVTANVSPGPGQRIDIEIVDSSPQKNVYLHKKNINSETRLAITSHAEGEVGVCFRNHLDHGAFLLVSRMEWGWRELTDMSVCLVWVEVPAHETSERSRVIDLDVDIGADAVDYKYATFPLSCV